MNSFAPCFLIPCYNHGGTVEAVVESIKHFLFPIIIVDDGSNVETKLVLKRIRQRHDVDVVCLAENTGKGGAVIAGLRRAQQLKYSHALQIDADGQHDVNAIPDLITASKNSPKSLVSGKPVYDEKVPKSRLYGRYITHVWVWIETLSFSIKDSMCGFRAYPLDASIQVLNKYTLGKRMDFDIEILVRMYWEGVSIEFIDTKVNYPEGGVSHFRAVTDNLIISWMHTRLFFGMFPRLPKLLFRRESTARAAHWSKTQEQGTVLGIKLMLYLYRSLGRKTFGRILRLVIYYYHLSSKQARQASEQYLSYLKEYAEAQSIVLPKPLSSYHHLLSFGYTMLDKLAAWQGDINDSHLNIHYDDKFKAALDSKKGLLLLGSHLGNIELCRALGQAGARAKINALVYTEHAERFNSVLKAVNPDATLNLIQVNAIGPGTAILLQQKIERGEWVVIVGDRTSTSKEGRSVQARFLGRMAPFPQGPFALAAILDAPVYLLFGLRDESSSTLRFNVYFEHFSDKVSLPRKERLNILGQLVQAYARRLEHYTLKAPLQWYNFYNFWTLDEQQDGGIQR